MNELKIVCFTIWCGFFSTYLFEHYQKKKSYPNHELQEKKLIKDISSKNNNLINNILKK